VFVVNYGQLRLWASECGNVKEWMKKNIDPKVFEEAIEQMVVGEFYIGFTGCLAKCVLQGEQYALIDVLDKGGMVGEHSSLDALSVAASSCGYKKITREEAARIFQRAIDVPF
jgi:hypothetical protein